MHIFFPVNIFFCLGFRNSEKPPSHAARTALHPKDEESALTKKRPLSPLSGVHIPREPAQRSRVRVGFFPASNVASPFLFICITFHKPTIVPGARGVPRLAACWADEFRPRAPSNLWPPPFQHRPSLRPPALIRPLLENFQPRIISLRRFFQTAFAVCQRPAHVGLTGQDPNLTDEHIADVRLLIAD